MGKSGWPITSADRSSVDKRGRSGGKAVQDGGAEYQVMSIDSQDLQGVVTNAKPAMTWLRLL
jgi:hypothetical protein